MELNKLEWLKRRLMDNNNNILLLNTNRPRSMNYCFSENIVIKSEIHKLQNTQERWNIRKEKRMLNNLINSSIEQPVKRKRL